MPLGLSVRKMRVPGVLALMALGVTCHAADVVPLKHGVYVVKGSGCDDAANAGIITFDGQAFGGAHEHDCHSTLVGKHDSLYIVKTDCADAGEGNARRHVETIVINRQKSTAFQLVSKSDTAMPDGALPYRWCSASLPK